MHIHALTVQGFIGGGGGGGGRWAFAPPRKNFVPISTFKWHAPPPPLRDFPLLQPHSQALLPSVFCTLEKHGQVFFQSAEKHWAVELGNEATLIAL